MCIWVYNLFRIMMENVEESDKKMIFGLYLWSGMIVFVLVILSWLFWNRQKRNNKVEEKITITPVVATPTETSKVELVWKSFEDTNNKWRIKYPSEWNDPSNNQQLVKFTTKMGISIDIMTFEDNSIFIADYLVKFDKQSKTAWEGQPSIKVISTKKTVINNLNCIQREEEML